MLVLFNSMYTAGDVRSRSQDELEALDRAYLCQRTSYQCRHLANQYEQQIYVR